MLKKLSLFTGFLLLCCTLLQAQTNVDVSGIWVGTATFLNSQSQLRYELIQKGDAISGTFSSRNFQNGDSIKALVSGVFAGNRLILDGEEILYRSGKACLSKVELDLILKDNTKMLTGKWKGDMRLTTCAPFVSGPITLRKEADVKFNNEDFQVEKQGDEIAADDTEGQALIRELGKRRYHALVIGIDKYEDDEIPNLDHPVNDATRLSDVLLKNYSFQEDNLVFLTNPTRGEIIAALDQLAREVTEKENLLIFYAGHGIWNEQLQQGYWLPADAANSSKAFWLSNSTLRDYVRGIPAKHTLLVTDACFSGGIFKERAIMGNSKALLEMYKLPSRKAMTSGTLKTVPDESVFMKYLLKALETNQSPLMSADQLFRGFKMTVINNSPNGQVPQYGPITQAGDEGGDFIFLKREQ